MIDWREIAIDFVLGTVTLRELPAIAERDLRSPDQPEALFELAFSEGCEDHILERQFRAVLGQLGIALPSFEEAAHVRIREAARKVIEGQLQPLEAIEFLRNLLKGDFYAIRSIQTLRHYAGELNDPEYGGLYHVRMLEEFRDLGPSDEPCSG